MPIEGVDTFAVGGFDLQTIIALVAMFLGLSVGVQVLLEVYKYFTTSKARIYRKALGRLLGAWVDENYGSSQMRGFLVEGPFSWLRPVTPQRFKERTPAHLLPMDQQELIAALERTAAPWVRRAVKALRQERELQDGTPAKASPGLEVAVRDMWRSYQTDSCAREVFDFLERWQVADKPVATDGDAADSAGGAGLDTPRFEDSVDAAATLEGLYDSFIPQYRTVKDEYEQFEKNFRLAYNRRTLRQTLILAFLMAVVFNLPFDELYRQAATRSAEELSALVESTQALYERAQSARATEGTDGLPQTSNADGSNPATGRAPGEAPEGAPPQDPAKDGGEGESPDDGKSQAPAVGNPPVPPAEGPSRATTPPGGGDDGPRDRSGWKSENGSAEASKEGAQSHTPETQLRDLHSRFVKALNKSLSMTAGQVSPLDRGRQRYTDWRDPKKDGSSPTILLLYLLNALITAVFLSFGAPFWNSVLDGLLALSRPEKRATGSAPEAGQ